MRLGFAFVLVLSGFVLFQNCSQPQSAFDGSQNESLAVEETVEHTVEDRDLTSDKVSCRFVGGESIGAILQEVLGLPQPDVAMVNSEGQPLVSNNCKTFNPTNPGRTCYYLAEYSADLNTRSCNASTFRLVSQIYINACLESVSDPERALRLFPDGVDNPGSLYLAFTGREPHDDEVQILNELADNFESETEKLAAVCAAVGSSLAAINSF